MGALVWRRDEPSTAQQAGAAKPAAGSKPPHIEAPAAGQAAEARAPADPPQLRAPRALPAGPAGVASQQQHGHSHQPRQPHSHHPRNTSHEVHGPPHKRARHDAPSTTGAPGASGPGLQHARAVSEQPRGAVRSAHGRAQPDHQPVSGPKEAAGAAAPAPTAAAQKATDSLAVLKAKEAEVQRLRQQLQATEAALKAKKAAKDHQEAEALRRQAAANDAERRRAQLAKGFASLASAVTAGEGAAGAGGGGPSQPVAIATKEDVLRVLHAQTDHQVLQVLVGCTAAEIKKAYRRLAGQLHPDKCQVPQAHDAFVRLTNAYNALLRRVGG